MSRDELSLHKLSTTKPYGQDETPGVHYALHFHFGCLAGYRHDCLGTEWFTKRHPFGSAGPVVWDSGQCNPKRYSVSASPVGRIAG